MELPQERVDINGWWLSASVGGGVGITLNILVLLGKSTVHHGASVQPWNVRLYHHIPCLTHTWGCVPLSKWAIPPVMNGRSSHSCMAFYGFFQNISAIYQPWLPKKRMDLSKSTTESMRRGTSDWSKAPWVVPGRANWSWDARSAPRHARTRALAAVGSDSRHVWPLVKRPRRWDLGWI